MGLRDRLSSWLRGGGGAAGSGERATVLLLGLDGAGKSSVLTALRPRDRDRDRDRQGTTAGDQGRPPPTLAAQHDHFNSGGVSISWCDVSGAARHRQLWERHYRRATAIVFVVDAADHLRLVVAREELHLALAHPALAARRVPLLLLANKSDHPNALPAASVANALGLESVVDKPWHVVSVSAASGAGLDSGVAWLARQLRDQLTRRHEQQAA